MSDTKTTKPAGGETEGTKESNKKDDHDSVGPIAMVPGDDGKKYNSVMGQTERLVVYEE